jgi:glycerophosphoryl diester phosphodiesterase
MPLVPIIYAHRGGAALRPENTIEAFDHGLACGADGIEFDVHLSRDDEVVIHHDATLERTTSGRGPVRSRTADELAGIDAAFNFRNDSGGFPFRGRGIGVPTLPEVLRRYPSALLIIELKVDGDHLARRVVEEVRAADAVGRVAIGSFFPRALQTVRDFEPAIATGAAKEETRWALYRSWIGLGIGATPYREFQVPERSGRTTIVTRRFVAAAHRAGIPVKVWTVNGVEDMRRLAGLGVDALITDRPDRARALVGDEPHGDAPGAHSRARR